MVTGDEGISWGIVRSGDNITESVMKELEDSATPGIGGSRYWYTYADAEKVITDLLGGIDGTEVTIMATDGTTRMLTGAGNTHMILQKAWVPKMGDTITLFYKEGYWWEKSRATTSYNGSIEYYDDFPWYVTAHFWTGTATGGTISVNTPSNASGGVLKMVTHTDDTDSAILAGTELVFSTGGDSYYFGTRLKTSRITQTELYAGLIGHVTDPADGGSDGYYFEFDSADDADHIFAVINTAGTVVTHDTAIHLAADTYTLLEILGNDTTVNFYVDGTLALSHAAIHDGFLARPIIKTVNKTGAAVTTSVDWAHIIAPK